MCSLVHGIIVFDSVKLMLTYLFDGLLSFFHLAELDVAEAKELMPWSD